MLTASLPHVECPSQGPIALKRALFCIECEVIFTDLAHCPRCCSDVVWPLAGWLSPALPDELRTPAPIATIPATASADLGEAMIVAH
jgi:hypothetical protein